MSATVPTKVEFDALAAKVALLQNNVAALGIQHNNLVSEVLADEGRIAALEVTPPPIVILPPPPVPLPTSSNVPAGFTRLTDQPWDSIISLGWNYLRRAASKDSIIINDPTGPQSPPNALRLIFTPDMGTDNEPGVHWHPLGLVRELFWDYRIRISAGWHASPAGATKMTYCMASSSNLWTGLLHPNVYPETDGAPTFGPPYKVGIRTEWIPRYYFPNHPWTPVNPGEWAHIECYAKLGSAGDGILRWWVNGNLNGEYLDVPNTPAAGFSEFQIAPTVQQPPPIEQYMDFDHMTVWVP